jgi:hypothetical protein
MPTCASTTTSGRGAPNHEIERVCTINTKGSAQDTSAEENYVDACVGVRTHYLRFYGNQ